MLECFFCKEPIEGDTVTVAAGDMTAVSHPCCHIHAIWGVVDDSLSQDAMAEGQISAKTLKRIRFRVKKAFHAAIKSLPCTHHHGGKGG